MARNHQFTLFFSEHEFQEAKTIALIEHTSLASLVRKALARYVRTSTRLPDYMREHRAKATKPEGSRR